MNSTTNTTTLVQAGLLNEPVTDALQQKLEALSREEVNAIISVKQKLGLCGQLNHPNVAECSF